MPKPKRELREVFDALDNEGRAIAPELARLNELIKDVLHANTIIAGDSSQVTYMGTTTFYRAQRPNSLLYMGTYATLGYGLPAVIGAKVAAPIDQLFGSLATAPSCSPYKKS